MLADVVHYTTPRPDAEERLLELEALTQTYGGIAVVKLFQRRAVPDATTFIGRGKVEELQKESKELGANVLIVNEILRPKQIFTLSEAFQKQGVKVWDRVDLILHIFDRHAKSAEAKLQIELARLRHMGPRIYNLGEQLGRQRGGTGTRGGSGEGNTETMKRHLKEQERVILKKLEKHEGMRSLHRAYRTRRGLKTVALVGYTNAGKTSLLNALTRRREYAADALFATLDTRVGEMYMGREAEKILISDTIGFIRDLPPNLIQAFHSTLSEAVNADLLLEVVDGADPRAHEKREVVEGVLAALGVAEKARLFIVSKADLLSADDREEWRQRGGIVVSSHAKEGLEELKEIIASRLSPMASV